MKELEVTARGGDVVLRVVDDPGGSWVREWGGGVVVVVVVVATARSPVSTAAILAKDTLRALFPALSPARAAVLLSSGS